jgi:hypothetical protein
VGNFIFFRVCHTVKDAEGNVTFFMTNLQMQIGVGFFLIFHTIRIADHCDDDMAKGLSSAIFYKRTVSRDFRPTVFSFNHSPLGQWLTS